MKKLFALLLAVVMVMGFAACSDDDTGSGSSFPTVTAPAAGNVKIVLWLNGAPDPGANNVILRGDFGAFTNAADTAGAMSGWGVVSTNEMAKVSDGVYSIEITPPSTNYTGAVAGKVINTDSYTDSWYGEPLQNKNWNFVFSGGVLSAIEYSDTGSWSKMSVSVQQNGTVGIVDLNSLQGWLVHKAGTLTQDCVLTINWTGVPASHDNNGNVWDDLTDGTAVVTGSVTNLHTDGTSTWAPALGRTVTVNADGTATVQISLKAGQDLCFPYKMARNTGWDQGEEAVNQGAVVTDAATATVSNPFNAYTP